MTVKEAVESTYVGWHTDLLFIVTLNPSLQLAEDCFCSPSISTGSLTAGSLAAVFLAEVVSLAMFSVHVLSISSDEVLCLFLSVLLAIVCIVCLLLAIHRNFAFFSGPLCTVFLSFAVWHLLLLLFMAFT